METTADRTRPLPCVAEGATLSALIAVSKAYAFTDAPSMLGRMLRTARWPSRLAVLASLVGTGIAIKWFQDTGVHIAAFAFVASVFWFRRDAFRDYYGKKRTATFLDTFSRRDQAFRYVMFREHVPDEIAGNTELLDRLRTLLDQRQKVRHAGLVTRHPLVTALVALFLMLLGVLISKLADASIPGTLMALFAVGMLALLAIPFSAIWRTREYRDEELAEFVLWLWAEAQDANPEPGTAL
jgi:hypothetical protein